MRVRIQNMSKPERKYKGTPICQWNADIFVVGILISFVLSYPLGLFLQSLRFASASRRHAFILA